MAQDTTTGGEERKHPGGRYTILTRALMQEIIGAVAAGGYFDTSCRAAGISREDGRMIVTVEDMLSCADALMKLQQLDHVMSVTLAYEHSDS